VSVRLTEQCRCVPVNSNGRVFSQAIDGGKYFRAECIRCDGATFGIPEESFRGLFFREWQKRDLVAHHKALNRAFDSTQGTAWTEPLRSAWRRFRTSSRHASEMEGSELPSRLSSSAATSGDRSLSGSSRASCRRWSTRAFMQQSLALGRSAVHLRHPPSNKSVETDTQRLTSDVKRRHALAP
jgi:hypothetical protein